MFCFFFNAKGANKYIHILRNAIYVLPLQVELWSFLMHFFPFLIMYAFFGRSLYVIFATSLNEFMFGVSAGKLFSVMACDTLAIMKLKGTLFIQCFSTRYCHKAALQNTRHRFNA